MLRKRWICLALLLVTAACFGHVCSNEFIHLDDPQYVSKNAHVLGGLTWPNVKWAFTDSSYQVAFWIPLTFLSLQLDATLFGDTGTAGFHLTNLLWHLANVVLFFLVLERMTGDLWRSAIAAAFFAIHPLRVESVAWVTERKDVVSTTFLLLTVAAYYRYVTNPSWGRYGLVLLAYLLSLMAKPTVVTLPFALLLLDYWPLYRLRLGQSMPASQAATAGVPWPRLVLEKLPLFAMSLAISLTTITISTEMGAVASTTPWSHRLSVVLSGYLAYLEKTIWPTNLAVLYPIVVPPWERVAIAAAILSVITLGLAYLGRRNPALIVGWFWFLGTLVPNSGVVQSGPQGLADRFTYIPHLGLMMAIVWGVGDLAVWRQATDVLRKTLVTLVLVILGALTWMQVCIWQDSNKLFNHSLGITGPSYTLHFNLSSYWLEQKDQKDYLKLAEEHIAKAVEVEPKNAKGHQAYGTVLYRQAKYAEAIEQLQICLQWEPRNPEGHYVLGLTFTQLRRWEEARYHLEKYLEHWSTHQRLGMEYSGDVATRQAEVHDDLGQACLRTMEPEKALGHFERALHFKPALAGRYQFFAAIALVRLGRWAEAEERLLRVAELDLANDGARGYLAYVYARQKKTEAADREYADLRKRFPAWLKNNNDLAMQLTTKEAMLNRTLAAELALQVCEATKFQDARSLDTLAATQAASGDFAKARETVGLALQLKSDPELRRQLRERLELYERDKALPVEKE